MKRARMIQRARRQKPYLLTAWISGEQYGLQIHVRRGAILTDRDAATIARKCAAGGIPAGTKTLVLDIIHH